MQVIAKTKRRRVGRVAFVFVCAAFCFQLPPLVRADEAWDSFAETWQAASEVLAGRIEVGLRIQHFELETESKRSFNEDGSFKEGFIKGTSVDRLEADQEYFPFPFVRFIAHDYVAVSMTYEKARAKTRTYYQPGTGYDGHTDGTIEIAGPALYLELRYPNETPLIPYAQLGLVSYSADFENDPGWSEGGYRQWRVSDATGTRLVLGLQWNINRNWGVEAFLARTDVDVDAAFYLAGNLRVSGTFPMSHDSYGLAARYRF